ncbi:MAG: MFS transporter [Acetobacter sp.]|nr:MFS transporter [Acetobacter sp.]
MTTLQATCDRDSSAVVDTKEPSRASEDRKGKSWLILFGLIAPINFLMSLDRQAMTLSAPRIQEQFGFSLIEISMIIACVLWTYAAFQVPTGILVNRFGPRICLFVGCLAWSFATILTPFSGSFLGFMVVRLFMGTGQSPDWSSSIVTINNWFSPRRRARANSVLLAFLYLGSVVGGPLTTQITERYSWKLSFFVYGAAGVIWSILWFVFVRDRPTSTPLPPPALTDRQDKGWLQFTRLLRSTQFWAIGLHYMCLLTIQSFFLVLMPFYLMQHRHMSYTSMGWLYSMPWLFLYLSVFVSGMIADHILKRSGSIWWARTPMGIIGTLFCGGLAVVGNLIDSTTLMILVFSVALAFSGLSQISIWTSVQDLTRTQAGILAGWTTCWGNAASGIAPIAMVYIVKHTGSWSAALSLPLVAGIIGALCCAWTHPERTINAENPRS